MRFGGMAGGTRGVPWTPAPKSGVGKNPQIKKQLYTKRLSKFEFRESLKNYREHRKNFPPPIIPQNLDMVQLCVSTSFCR
jgi:hypothetical protein